MVRNKASFYGEELLAPRPTSKLEDHPLSAAHNCLFNIFAVPLHIGGRSSICNRRTRHALVTVTHRPIIDVNTLRTGHLNCLNARFRDF